MTNRSTIAARHPVQSRPSNAWILWTMAALCSLAAAPLARAAGCHSQERPVIYGTLSWETDQRIQQVPALTAQAPAVLTHPRCGDEFHSPPVRRPCPPFRLAQPLEFPPVLSE